MENSLVVQQVTEQKAQIRLLVRFHAGVFGLFFAFNFGFKNTIFF